MINKCPLKQTLYEFNVRINGHFRIYFRNGSIEEIPIKQGLVAAYSYVRNKINYRSVDLVFIEKTDGSTCIHNRNWDFESNFRAKETPK